MEVEYLGVKLFVSFFYIEAEPQTKDYIGAPESVEIENIQIKDENVYDLFSYDQLAEIEYIILKNI